MPVYACLGATAGIRVTILVRILTRKRTHLYHTVYKLSSCSQARIQASIPEFYFLGMTFWFYYYIDLSNYRPTTMLHATYITMVPALDIKNTVENREESSSSVENHVLFATYDV